jgi:hypothetical protein
VPGGRLSIHPSRSRTPPTRRTMARQLDRTYIFPGGLCPSLAVISSPPATRTCGHRHARHRRQPHRTSPPGNPVHSPDRDRARWASTIVSSGCGSTTSR